MTNTKYLALGIIIGYLTPYLMDLRNNHSNDDDFFAPGSNHPTHFSTFTNQANK